MCSPKRKDLLSHPPAAADRRERSAHCGNCSATMRRTNASSMTSFSTSILSVVPTQATRGLILFGLQSVGADRKSTRLNSSHLVISYAVFCLKKKKNNECS